MDLIIFIYFTLKYNYTIYFLPYSSSNPSHLLLLFYLKFINTFSLIATAYTCINRICLVPMWRHSWLQSSIFYTGNWAPGNVHHWHPHFSFGKFWEKRKHPTHCIFWEWKGLEVLVLRDVLVGERVFQFQIVLGKLLPKASIRSRPIYLLVSQVIEGFPNREPGSCIHSLAK